MINCFLNSPYIKVENLQQVMPCGLCENINHVPYKPIKFMFSNEMHVYFTKFML
jgi:hypothetical protein